MSWHAFVYWLYGICLMVSISRSYPPRRNSLSAGITITAFWFLVLSSVKFGKKSYSRIGMPKKMLNSGNFHLTVSNSYIFSVSLSHIIHDICQLSSLYSAKRPHYKKRQSLKLFSYQEEGTCKDCHYIVALHRDLWHIDTSKTFAKMYLFTNCL